MGIRDVVILAFFIGSLPFCFFRPFYGVLLWSIVSFLNPHRFAWSAAHDFPVAMIVGAPTIVGFLSFSRDWKALRTREFVMMVVLGGWFTITSLAAAGQPAVRASHCGHVGEVADRLQDPIHDRRHHGRGGQLFAAPHLHAGGRRHVSAP